MPNTYCRYHDIYDCWYAHAPEHEPQPINLSYAQREDRDALIERMGLRTVSEYLDDPDRIEDPNPYAGTDYEDGGI